MEADFEPANSSIDACSLCERLNAHSLCFVELLEAAYGENSVFAMQRDEGGDGAQGDKINALSAAIGFNFRKLLKGILLRLYWLQLRRTITSPWSTAIGHAV